MRFALFSLLTFALTLAAHAAQLQPPAAGKVQPAVQKVGGDKVGKVKAGEPKGKGKTALPKSPPRVREENLDEQTVRAAGLSTDGDSLLEFFRERMQPKADRDPLLTIARQLGDTNGPIRAKAATKLISIGPSAIPALRHVLNELEDPQAAQEARRCLEWTQGPRSAELCIAAARLLAAQQSPAAAETLMAFLPLADDANVSAALKGALDRLATRPGKVDPALLAALRDELPLRRAVAASVLAASGRSEVLPQIRELLNDKKPQVRLRVALALTQRLDEKAVAVLIDLLAELPTQERTQAEQALQQLAGAWAPSPQLAMDDDLSRRIRREAWVGWWHTMEGPNLLAALRQRTLSGDELAGVQKLILQLGDGEFGKRERAVKELVAAGPKVIALLREAVKSGDLEQSRRADLALKQILRQEEQEKLPTAAPRLLAVRKPEGACLALLNYLPFTDDRAMKEEVGKALTMLAMVDGKPDAAVIAALTDSLPIRRVAASEALVRAGGTKLPQVRQLLNDADPQMRLRVSIALVHALDKEGIPTLIDLLAALPLDQAREAEDLLYRVAGPDAPAIANAKDSPQTRKTKQEAWQAWWQTHGATVDLASLESVASGSGLILVVELGGSRGIAVPPPGAVTDRLVAVDRDGKVHWQIGALQRPSDFQILPGSRVLVAEYASKRVTERDLSGKILWEVPNLPGAPVNVQRLPNGNTFIALYNSATIGGIIMEVDQAGKTVHSLNVGRSTAGPQPPVAANDGLMIAAHKTVDGDYVCLLTGSPVVIGLQVRIDKAGKEIKRFEVPNINTAGVFYREGNIDVTAKGHLLVFQNKSTLVEYDPEGKVVWQVNVAGNRASRLASGNTLVASDTGVIEVDGAGKVVWQYKAPTGYQPLRARQDAIGVARPSLGIVAPARPPLPPAKGK